MAFIIASLSLVACCEYPIPFIRIPPLIRVTVSALGSAIAVNWWPQFEDFQKFKVVVVIWLVASAVGDVLITFILVWYLVRWSYSPSPRGVLTLLDRTKSVLGLRLLTISLIALCAVSLLIPSPVYVFTFVFSDRTNRSAHCRGRPG